MDQESQEQAPALAAKLYVQHQVEVPPKMLILVQLLSGHPGDLH